MLLIGCEPYPALNQSTSRALSQHGYAGPSFLFNIQSGLNMDGDVGVEGS